MKFQSKAQLKMNAKSRDSKKDQSNTSLGIALGGIALVLGA